MPVAGSPARKACRRTHGAPRRRYPPDPRTHDSYHDRLRDFAERMKSGTLGRGDGPGLSGGPGVLPGVLIRGRLDCEEEDAV